MADFLITFQGWPGDTTTRDPEVVTADDVLIDDAAVILHSNARGVEAIYPPCLGASVRRLPDPPEDGTLARMWRVLRWAATS